MSDENKARLAHNVLDGLSAGRILSRENEQLLRSFLPELPKQLTLEKIIHDVYDAWAGTNGNEWPDDIYCDLETWLAELHTQLKGLADVEPTAVPALPASMRLADHEQYGRVVTSPKPNRDGVYDLLVPKPTFETGADWEYAHECELTFIDAEPAKPAHPEFLETEADYQNAPVGTVAIREGGYPWTRIFGSWVAYSRNNYSHSEMAALRGKARILRWGDGK